MTKLNQIVAVEKGVKATANRTFTDAYQDIQAAGLFLGQSRTYQPRVDGADTLPPEHTKVQATVGDQLDRVSASLTRLFDVFATKDTANTEAKADVIVDGQVIAEGLPPTTLLTLEKYLGDVRTFVSKLPVLDPAIDWHEDTATGLYRSETVVTNRTAKEPRVIVKYQATDKHPAQTDLLMEDKVVGEYTAVKLSGGIPKDRRDELVERVGKLIEAVKFAREEANSLAVEDVQIGSSIFGYLFA